LRFVAALDQIAQALRVGRKLDQHHAKILHHGEQHLAQSFELRVGLRAGRYGNTEAFDLRHAGGALDQGEHLGTDLFAHTLACSRGGRRKVDQQGGRDRLVIHRHASKHRGRSERVLEHSLAARERAIGQLGPCDGERALDDALLVGAVAGAELRKPRLRIVQRIFGPCRALCFNHCRLRVSSDHTDGTTPPRPRPAP
jgi:hypothetical protein